jgi:hypothetical protein
MCSWGKHFDGQISLRRKPPKIPIECYHPLAVVLGEFEVDGIVDIATKGDGAAEVIGLD